MIDEHQLMPRKRGSGGLRLTLRTLSPDRRRSTTTGLFLFVALTLVHMHHARAVAQADTGAAAKEPSPAELESARSMFREGLQLIDEQAWADAADRFARVLDIKWSPVAAYNLGVARSRVGQLVAARTVLERVLSDINAPDDVRDPAALLLAEIMPRIARLVVHIEDDDGAVRVTVDGESWPRASWGVAAAIDPGLHEVKLWQGETAYTTHVDVKEGSRAETVLRVPRSARPTAQVPPPALAARATKRPFVAAELEPDPAREPRDTEGESVLEQWWFWTGVGVLAAAVVTTAVVLSADDDSGAPTAGDFDPPLLEIEVGQ